MKGLADTASNEQLEFLPDKATARWRGVTKQAMFGGVVYLLRGNMCLGAWRDFLIGRFGDKAAALRRNAAVSDMDITGRPMTGWIKAAEKGWKDRYFFRTLTARPAQLEGWIDVSKSVRAAMNS